MVNAICVVASAVRNRVAVRVPSTRPPGPPNERATVVRTQCTAGNRPNRAAVPRLTPSVNTSSAPLISNVVRTAGAAGRAVERICSVVRAASSPPTPPAIPRRQASIRRIRTTPPAEDPSDRRTAISGTRSAPRASIRFARFAQAMSSTSPVTPMARAKIGRPSARLRASAVREPSSTVSRRSRNCARALASSAGP